MTALQLTVAPRAGFPLVSTTSTTRGLDSNDPTGPDWVLPETLDSFAGAVAATQNPLALQVSVLAVQGLASLQPLQLAAAVQAPLQTISPVAQLVTCVVQSMVAPSHD